MASKTTLSINRKQVLAELKGDFGDGDRRNITFSLPESLIKAFRRDCDQQGLKMNRVIQKLMEDFIKAKG